MADETFEIGVRLEKSSWTLLALMRDIEES
jgi:hypothetical protein